MPWIDRTSWLINEHEAANIRRDSNLRWYLEQEKLKKFFPQFALTSKNGHFEACVGTLTTNCNNAYAVRVFDLEKYPDRFYWESFNNYPPVTITSPSLKPSPHRYGAYMKTPVSNGVLCLMSSDTWIPAKCTLAFLVAKTALWLNKYDYYLNDGIWHGAQDGR